MAETAHSMLTLTSAPYVTERPNAGGGKEAAEARVEVLEARVGELTEQAVPDADRYRGTETDEARLFYVAPTRAQKYLALSYSPGSSSMYAG
ncbi:hypothetical protein, partial [Frankia sp. Cr2]|uniref:hypothetical protein n=1 Tax=Frankia sp. Cr2 TaxID=3073932 RepID=UPI002AD2C994